MQELKLTKRAIENLPHTKSGQSFYRDTVLAGFGLRVGKTSKTFYVERKLHNKSKRISLGRFGLVSLEEARAKALSLLADMADGVDPTAQEDEAEDRNITVYGAFQHLFETRPHLSKVTVEGYKRSVSGIPGRGRPQNIRTRESVARFGTACSRTARLPSGRSFTLRESMDGTGLAIPTSAT